MTKYTFTSISNQPLAGATQVGIFLFLITALPLFPGCSGGPSKAVTTAVTSSVSEDASTSSTSSSSSSSSSSSTPTMTFTAGATSSDSESTASPTISVTLSSAQTSAVTADYTISGGTATGAGTDYTLASGTLTFSAGTTSQSIPLSVVSDSLDENDETVIIALSNYSGATAGSNTSHTFTITDDDSAPTVTFGAGATSSGGEGTAGVTLAVTLSAASAKSVTVDYAVTGGTATSSGTDYTLASGTLTFNAGTTSQNISLTVADDSLDENDETVIIGLSNYSNSSAGAATSHTFTITDDDSPPTITFGAGASSSGSESTTSVSLAVNLSAASGKTVTADYAVTSGTATSGGTDYTLASGTLTFNAGTTSQNISMTVVNDLTVESGETVVIGLSNLSNASSGADVSHTYTINDNDWAWNTDAAGNWNTAASWNPASVPNATDIGVTFGSIITTNRVVTMNTNATVGTLVFSDDNNYGIAASGGNTITFDVSSGSAALNILSTGSATTTIQPPIQVNDDLDITVTNSNTNTLGASGTTGGFTGGNGITIKKKGSGSLNLDGPSSAFSGTMYLEAGTLKARYTSNSLGTGQVTLENGDGTNSSILLFDTINASQTFTNNIQLVDTRSNDFYINTNSTNAPTLSGQISTSSAIDNEIIFGGNNSSTATGIILSGDNSGITFAGAQTIQNIAGGAIRVASANALGTNNSLPVTLATATPGAGFTAAHGVQIDTSGLTVTSTINIRNSTDGNSNGALTLGGNHTTGTSTFSGNITLNSNSGTVNKSSAFQALGTSTVTFSGVITSNGAAALTPVNKSGAGTVEFSGANTYTGLTTVNAGTLKVSNTSGSATGTGNINVATGTLSGTGIITGLTTLANSASAILAPANAGSTALRLNGGLTFNNSSVASYVLGTNSDLVTVTGNLTLDGTLNVTAGTGFTTGTYTLITYTGTLTNNTMAQGTLPGGYTYTIDTGTAGQVNLVVSP